MVNQEPTAKKAHQFRLNAEILFTFSIDYNSVVYREFLEECRMVNKKYYIELMHRLPEANAANTGFLAKHFIAFASR